MPRTQSANRPPDGTGSLQPKAVTTLPELGRQRGEPWPVLRPVHTVADSHLQLGRGQESALSLGEHGHPLWEKHHLGLVLARQFSAAIGPAVHSAQQ